MSNASSKAPIAPAPNKPEAHIPDTEPAIPRVPWKPWLGLLFLAFLYYGSQFLGGVIISIYPFLKHWSDAQAQSWLNDSTAVQFVYILLAEAISIAGVYFFLKYYKVGFSKIGLKKPRWSDAAIGVAAAPAYFVIYFISVALVSHFVPSFNASQQQQIGFDNVHTGIELLMTFISLVILPPLAEEIMVRGFLYSSLKKAMPTIWAVLLTSAIFASAHLPEGGAAGPLYVAALDTFILSLVLIYLREKTGSLWASITLHAIKNGVAFFALFALHFR